MANETLRNHPQLVAEWATYSTIADLMTNDIGRARKHLIQHRSESDGTKEGIANWQNRLNRLYRSNYVSPYVTIHTSHMSQPLTVAGADDERLKVIQADSTGFRQSLTQMARERLHRFCRDGKVGALVDSPAVIAKDRATARATKERSYQVVYDACDIRNWEVFAEGARKGQFKEVLLAEPTDGKRARFRRLVIEDSENAKFHWQILETKTKSFLTAAEKDFTAEVVDEGEGGIGRIPFVVFGCGPDDSLVADVWPLDIAIMNLTSVLSNIVYNQGFQRSLLAGVAPEEIEKITEFTVTLLRNTDARIFTIDPGDPAAAEKEIEKLKKEADRRGKFEFNQLSDDTRQVQSADSKAKDLVTRKALYDATLDYQEDIETEILRLHAEFEGVDPADISVSIGREYGLEDEQAELNKLGLVWGHARELGAHRLRKEILRIEAAKLPYLPSETETTEEVQRAVLDEIATLPAPSEGILTNRSASGLFGGLFNS